MRSVPSGVARRLGSARRRTAVVAVVATAAVLVSGCGKPDNLDTQQAGAQARECVSLLERRVSINRKTGQLELKVGLANLDLSSEEPELAGAFEAALAGNQIGPDDISAPSRVRATALSDLCDKVVRDHFTPRDPVPTTTTTSAAPSGD